MQNQKGNISVIISFVIVALVIGFGVYYLAHNPNELETQNALEKSTNDTKNATDQNSINTKPTENQSQQTNKPMNPNKRLLQNFTPVSKVANLEKVDLVVGTGEEVKPGATVSVHYTGAVASTGEIFQSSKDFGTAPVSFGLGQVIKGWTDGIPGMKIGGTRRLLIPAAQAYGATPPPNSGIPANADLVFDVELVAVK